MSRSPTIPLRMIRAARFVAQLECAAGAPRGRRRSARCASGWRSSPPSGCARSSTSCWWLRRRRRGWRSLVDTGLAEMFLPEAACAAARAGPRPAAQGRAAPHLRGGRRAREPRRAPAARRAAARHRQARDARRSRPRAFVPSPRGRRRADGARAARRAALSGAVDGRRLQADRAAPPLPRLRRGEGGPTPPSAATSATRARCSTS